MANNSLTHQTELYQHRLRLIRKLGLEDEPHKPPSQLAVQRPQSRGTSKESEFDFRLLEAKAPVDVFRVNYLRKLSYANVWIPSSRRPPNHQTVVLFDWDDTLLCTSHLNRHAAADGSSTEGLEALENQARILLEMALKFGRVYIVTNAMEGWVEFSSAKYLPGLVSVLQRITIISARHKFEGSFPGEFYKWKSQAFLEVKRSLDNEIVTNLISVGDSMIEMDAVHIMGGEFSQALVKTIKLRENPTPDELTKQLELVCGKFESICLNARNLRIGLERKWVAKV